MEKLDEGSFRKILQAIEILGEDLEFASFPRRAVRALSAAVDVDFVSYNEVDRITGTHRFLLQPDPAELDPGSFEYAAFVRRFGNHPVVAQRVAIASRDDPNLLQFVNRVRLFGMVGNCCGQAELRLNLAMTIKSAASLRIGIALHRSIRDFDDRDAAILDALRPHIVTAYRNSARSGGASPGSKTRDQAEPGAPQLTPRESQVLYWVSMGKTNEEVSRIVGAKPMTIKKHLEHIYDKLGVPNRTAAARITLGHVHQAQHFAAKTNDRHAIQPANGDGWPKKKTFSDPAR
jgi:DNA-binding CsgD family transcriptional regulator